MTLSSRLALSPHHSPPSSHDCDDWALGFAGNLHFLEKPGWNEFPVTECSDSLPENAEAGGNMHEAFVVVRDVRFYQAAATQACVKILEVEEGIVNKLEEIRRDDET